MGLGAGGSNRKPLYELLAVTLFSGPICLDAEGQWTSPNTCVEITFKPATKTKKLGPNESVSVKAELRTKKEQTVVPAEFKEAKERPREGNLRVSGSGTTTFHVTGGSISEEGEPFAVTLYILPGQTTETSDVNCPGVAQRRDPSSFWSAMFNVSRFQRFNYAKNGYEVADWTLVLNSDVMAKKMMRVSCSIGINTCQEETPLTLRQTDRPSNAP